MKRRDFIQTSSIATTSPLFIDIDLDEILGDSPFSGLFGGPDRETLTTPIEDRIGHPPPEISVRIDEDQEDGYTAILDVHDTHGWEVLNAYPQYSRGADQGASQKSLDLDSGDRRAELPADRDDITPPYVPHDIDLAFEAMYGRDNIYFARARYSDGRLDLATADEVPNYCWWDGWFGCRINDPIPNPDMPTPR